MLAARLGILLLAAVAAVAALVLGGNGERAGGQGSAAERYACPMHPTVVASAPRSCPICGMALERLAAGGGGRRGADDGTSSPGSQATRFLSYGAAPVHRRVLAPSFESPAWLDAQGGVTALLFEDELKDLRGDESATFFAARAPGVPRAVERTAEAPSRWRGSLWGVRFRFGSRLGSSFAPGGDPPPGLRVGATGWIDRPALGRTSLVVLSSAVLQSFTGPYVLGISPEHRTYRRQPISTGRVVSGYSVVVSGASERELVFALNAFSLDADARLHAQRRAAAAEIAEVAP